MLNRLKKPAIQLVIIVLAVAATITPNMYTALIFVGAFFVISMYTDRKDVEELEKRTKALEELVEWSRANNLRGKK